MKRIYFDIDNLAPLGAWLKQRPAGRCQMLIGSDRSETEAIQAVMASVGEDRNLGAWLRRKIQAGELQVKVSAKIAGMPQGVEL